MRLRRWTIMASGIAAAIVAGSASAASAAVASTAAPAAIKPPCCRVLTRSAAVAWGDDGVGQLGNGITGNASPNWTPVTGLTSGVTQVAGGGFGSLALTSDGLVLAWGLADLTGDQGLVPVPVPGLAGITQVAAGQGLDLALRSDGTVWAWGAGGVLGNNSYTPSNTPVRVAGLTGITQIAAGYQWAMALRSDGTVWSWGLVDHGNLGTGTSNDSLVPAQVTGLSQVTRIAAGGLEGMAVATRGLTTQSSVYTWGDNAQGEIGDGSYYDRVVPFAVAGISVPSVAGIAVGGDFAMVLGTDGTLWDWGANTRGQLGNGSTNVVIRPAEARGLDSGITQIAAGYEFALARHADGTVWAWGAGDHGELGNGTTTGVLGATPAPVQVTGLSGVTQISAGYSHGLAIHQVPLFSLP
jgi:alpha-tubulin suppressor-like RCC1 family protein